MTPRAVGEFARLIGGSLVAGSPGELVSGAMVDTRRLEPGHAFFAIKGARADGHNYCAAALAAGAACAVVERTVDVAMPQIRVETVKGALARMARGLIAEWNPMVVAITGSVGKTSVKSMAGLIASRRWATAVAPGNLNSELGMPLAIANADFDASLLVLEFAMRGKGQIRELAQMVPPHVSLVTNIGLSHMEILGSREAIAEAKREIYEETRPDGIACVPADDAFAQVLEAGVTGRRLRFGLSGDAAVRGTDLRQVSAGTALYIHYAGESTEVLVPAPGQHHGRNAVAAAAAVLALGASLSDVAEGLLGFEPEPHRGRLLRAARGFQVIDDCYNASPDSMKAALDVLIGRPCAGRRIAVLGDMLELGAIAESEHIALGTRAAGMGVDALIGVGDLGQLIVRGASEADPSITALHLGTQEATLEWLRNTVGPEDIVLIKASRGLALENLVRDLVEEGDAW